jgi:hypothetical protein
MGCVVEPLSSPPQSVAQSCGWGRLGEVRVHGTIGGQVHSGIPRKQFKRSLVASPYRQGEV